jgi:hypothetical protein
MKKILVVFKSYFLQFLIGILAIASYQEAILLGETWEDSNGIYYKERYDQYEGKANPTSVAITSGFQGGAIAMGLICSTCLIAFTLIEVNKTKD